MLRSTPNPDGDGAGNFQRGWGGFIGPVSGRIEPQLSGGEDTREGQIASRQRFLIHVRANPKTRRIDARDRVEEIGGASRVFNILANVSEPADTMVRLVAEQTPVESSVGEFVSEFQSEGVPEFPVGP